MTEQIPWEQWKTEFIKELVNFTGDPVISETTIAHSPLWDTWKQHYDRGLTPSQAIEVDFPPFKV
jgi:hypothetical protein